MAKPSQNVEKSRFVPQLAADRWQTVEDFIRANRRLFSTNGSVAAEWRSRNGFRFGPYFRLKYRGGGYLYCCCIPSNISRNVRALRGAFAW